MYTYRATVIVFFAFLHFLICLAFQFDDKYISDTGNDDLAQNKSFEYGSDDLWLWRQGEWKQLHAAVAAALGGGGRLLEVRRTGHCLFIHGSRIYMYGGYYKDSPETSKYCDDFVVLDLQNTFGELSNSRFEPFEASASRLTTSQSEIGGSPASHMLVLRRLLAAVGATSSVRQLLEDGIDDDDVAVLSLMRPHKVSVKYGMTEAQAQEFVNACRIEIDNQQQFDNFSETCADQALQEVSKSGLPEQISERSGGTMRAKKENIEEHSSIKDDQDWKHGSTKVQNSFGNRMQMITYSSLNQFHFGALHVALKFLFPSTADVDGFDDSHFKDDLEIDSSEFFFRLKILTLNEFGAGTDADVFVTLVDSRGRETNEVSLDMIKCEAAIQSEKVVAAGGLPKHVTLDLFERGSYDSFMIRPLIQGKFRPSGIRTIKGKPHERDSSCSNSRSSDLNMQCGLSLRIW